MKKHILHIFLALLYTSMAGAQIVESVYTGLPYTKVLCVGADDSYVYTLCNARFPNNYQLFKWTRSGFGDTILLQAGNSSRFNVMRTFNKKLFVAGKMDTILFQKKANLVFYDGFSWQDYLDTSDKSLRNYELTDLETVNNRLYAVGHKDVGPDHITAILLCDSLYWDSIAFPANMKVTALTTDGSNLYALVSEE